jgi:hypothetical protein
MVGTTLVELLVAVTLSVLILGTALAAIVPASSGFRTLPEHADVQQRLRSVADTLRAEVWGAASGAVATSEGGTSPAWPVVLPCGWGLDPVSGSTGSCARPDTFSIVRAERNLTVLTSGRLAADTADVPVQRPAGCPSGSPDCEFVVGDHVMIGDGTGFVDGFVVTGVGAFTGDLAHPGALSTAYERGSMVTSAVVRTYYSRPDASTDSLQLRRLDGESDVPVVDHLAAFAVEYAGLPDVPAVSRGASGQWTANYGLQPRLSRDETGEPDGGVLPSCAFGVVDGEPVSTLSPLTAGADGLAAMPLAMLADGPWCPDSDSPHRFDADLFRVRRIRIVVRIQSPAPWSRGSRSGFYARPGTGTDAARLVPDAEVRFDIAARGVGR